MISNYYEAHTHIALDGADYKAMKALHVNEPNEEHIRRVFMKYKDNNISFIRDGGDAWGLSILAKRIAPEYNIDYRTPGFAIHKAGFYGSILGISYQSINDYKDLVMEALKSGCDFIKIMASGIMDFNEYNKISPCGISLDELKDMINIAHDYGLSVMAHTNGTKEIMNAIQAGVDSIEHGYYMDPECLFGIKEKNIIWVPTITPVANLLHHPAFNHQIIRSILDNHKANIKRAIDQEILLGLGSDAGSYLVPHANGCINEYELLNEIYPDTTRLDILLKTTQDKLNARFSR